MSLIEGRKNLGRNIWKRLIELMTWSSFYFPICARSHVLIHIQSFYFQDDRFVFKQMSRFEIQSFVKFAPNYFDYVSTAVIENKLTTLCKVNIALCERNMKHSLEAM